MPSTRHPQIAFVGLGQMGRALVGHLVRAGVEVIGVDPSPVARRAAETIGMTTVSGLHELGRAEVVFASVPGPPELWEVAHWMTGSTAVAPSLLVNLATVGPDTAEGIAGFLSAATPPVAYVEAPVTGGVLPAGRGECTIIVGADDARARDLARSYLSLMSRKLIEFDSVRLASIAKLVNNVAAVVSALATAEALEFGVSAGIPIERLFDVLENGTARSYVLESTVRRPLIDGNFNTGFATRLALKDMKLAADCADDLGTALGCVEYAIAALARGVASGLGDNVFPAVVLRREVAAEGVTND